MDTQTVRLQPVQELLRVRLCITFFIFSRLKEVRRVVRAGDARELAEDLAVQVVDVAIAIRKPNILTKLKENIERQKGE